MKYAGGITCLILGALFLQGCVTTPPDKPRKISYEIGTGSRISILDGRETFQNGEMPTGWVMSGMDREDLFAPNKKIRHVTRVRKNATIGLHIQNAPHDFILAKYTKARLLVTPYLTWYWHVSEHQGSKHPVRLLIGFYGGNRQNEEPVIMDRQAWRDGTLPPYDRLLSIGFDDLALKRANLYPMSNVGSMRYYVQRGGVEQTNQWYFEAADLSIIYRRAWPNDMFDKTFISFVGFWADNDPGPGGITFSKVELTR